MSDHCHGHCHDGNKIKVNVVLRVFCSHPAFQLNLIGCSRKHPAFRSSKRRVIRTHALTFAHSLCMAKLASGERAFKAGRTIAEARSAAVDPHVPFTKSRLTLEPEPTVRGIVHHRDSSEPNLDMSYSRPKRSVLVLLTLE